jgi:hypothetical protein
VKKLAAGLGRSAAVVLIVLLLLELALRLVPGVIPGVLLERFEKRIRGRIATGRYPTEEQTVPFERDDRGFPFRIKKPFSEISYSFGDHGTVNVVVMDELGFCNAPGSYDPDPIEIITLGDSFTWCTTVRPEDTWTSRLQEFTGSHAYNLGTPGVGLYEYVQVLRKLGLQKNPAVVVLNVYEGNDLRDALLYHRYKEDFDANEAERARGTDSHGGLLRRHSYAVNAIRAAYQVAVRGTRDTVDFRYELVFPGQSVPFNRRNTDIDEVKSARRLQAEELDMALLVGALEDYVRLSEEHTFVPVVSYTPAAYTAYQQFVRFAQPDLKGLMQRFSREQREMLQREARRLGYVFVDLTPFLQDAAPAHAAPENLLYFQNNLHLTARGHEVIARALRDALEALPAAEPLARQAPR